MQHSSYMYAFVVHCTAVIGASLSEPHTSVTALCTHVCMLVCLDRPLIINFKWPHLNISRWLTWQMCTSAKPWERAWRAMARMQGRREREQVRRRFKLNALVARTATFCSELWGRVWWSLHKAGCEWQEAGCTLASSTCLAWQLIHSMDSSASSWFDCQA